MQVLKGSRSISGSHARIVIHPTKLRTARLVDLGSLNGCFVNDDRVHNASADLRSGDVIRFGYDKDVYIFHFPQDIPASILGETLLSPGAAGTGGAGTRTHSLSQRIPQPPSSRSPSEARMPQESASPGSSAFGAAPRLRGSARNAHQLTPAPQVERDRAGPLAYSEHTNEAERVRMVQSVNRNSVESDNASSPPSYVLADSLALSATPSRPPIIAQPISFSASMGDRSQGGVVNAHVPSVSALNQSQLGDISGSVEPLGVYIASPPFHSPAPGSSSDEVSGSYEGVVRAEAAHAGESASAHTAGTTHGGRRRAAAAGAMNSTFGAGTGVDDVYGAVASQFAPIASVSIPTVTLESGEIRARDSSAGTARSFTASATGGHRYSGTTSSARRSTSTPPSAASSTLPPSRTGSHVPSSNAVTPGLLHVQQHGDSTGELPAAATAGAAAADSAVSPEAVHSLLSGMQQDRQTLVTVMQGVNDLLVRLNASQGGGGRTATLTTLSPSPLQT
ncbi:MAG: FHA domain-containing protein, partial [Methanosarcinales archaeon]